MAKVQGLKISTVGREVFYRSGLAITKAGIEVQRASLTDEQVEALTNEQHLRVIEAEIDVPDEQVVKAKKGAAKKADDKKADSPGGEKKSDDQGGEKK